MQKFLLWLFLLLPLFVVQAQTPLTLEEVHVQLWPEEDKPAVLVLYDFKAAADAPFPITLEIPLPAEAELNAVAREESGTLITVEHQLVGAGEAVRFTLTDNALYRLEYYFPYQKQGIHRHFVYRWPGTYAVRTFLVDLKEPLGAQNLVTQPPLTNTTQLRDFTYHSLTFTDLPAGKTLEIAVDYDKRSDALNISSSTLTSQTVPSSAWPRWLPLILGSTGLLLILAGILYYWRNTLKLSRKKAPSGPKSAPQKQASITAVYCRKCGERAHPGDRYCRKCGAYLGEVSKRP